MNIEELTEHHRKGCKEYKKIIEVRFKGEEAEDIYIHSSIFKEKLLASYADSEMIEYSSSGTSGQPSRIIFSRKDSIEQQRLLVKTITPYLRSTKKRLFVELCFEKNESNNARKAAGRGFSLLGKKRIKISPDQVGLEMAIRICQDEEMSMMIFGFTFEVYEFLKKLKSKNEKTKEGIDLIHGGGWKKLQSNSITNKDFNNLAKQKIEDINVINYYGMVEQLGLIYPSCKEGYFHVPPDAKIIIRDKNGERTTDGKAGIIQSISLLPKSYPGHSILTEDIGRKISGICKCGRNTDRFEFIQRIKKAETRGCSDAY